MGATQSTRKITLVNDDKAGVIKLSESLAYRLRGQIEGQQAAPGVPEPAVAAEPAPPQIPPAPVPPPALAPSPPPIFTAPQVPEPPKISDYIPEPEPQVTEPPPAAPAAAPQEEVEVQPPALVVPLPPPPPPAAPEGEEVVATEPTAAPDIGIAVKSGAAPTLSQPAGSIPPWSIYAEEAHLMVMRLREEKEQEMKKLNNEWHKKMETREEEFTKIARLSEEQVTTSLKEVENLFMKATCSPVCQNHQEAVMNCYNDHPQQSLRCAREVEQFTQCVDLSRLQSVLRPKAN